METLMDPLGNERPLDPKGAVEHCAERGRPIAESTLAKYRSAGTGPAFLRFGRRILYRPSALDQWLQSRTSEVHCRVQETA
jgi:hypothetical protein